MSRLILLVPLAHGGPPRAGGRSARLRVGSSPEGRCVQEKVRGWGGLEPEWEGAGKGCVAAGSRCGLHSVPRREQGDSRGPGAAGAGPGRSRTCSPGPVPGHCGRSAVGDCAGRA